MKTSTKTKPRAATAKPASAKKEIDWGDVAVYSLVAICVLPICFIGLIVQNMNGLGLAIFVFGTWLVIRQMEQGWATALIASVYTITGAVLLWNQQFIAAVIVAVGAIAWEIIRPRFIAPKPD